MAKSANSIPYEVLPQPCARARTFPVYNRNGSPQAFWNAAARWSVNLRCEMIIIHKSFIMLSGVYSRTSPGSWLLRFSMPWDRRWVLLAFTGTLTHLRVLIVTPMKADIKIFGRVRTQK